MIYLYRIYGWPSAMRNNHGCLKTKMQHDVEKGKAYQKKLHDELKEKAII